ncbi:hypothetical protein [Candidatus Clostridium radicumherbarum]|uniref:Uncharacterized protein n=1 Tax=Candidatus Clostridium radicumherbarum TaxID=3381662 RepID=A0ABW8TUU3_9CLOT
MKKIGSLICIACISMSIAGCTAKTTSQVIDNKAEAKNNITVKDGTEKLKPLELVGPSTPYNINKFIVECDLPQAPEKVEVFKPTNVRDAEGSINYRPSNESLLSTEDALDFEKAAQVAEKFLVEKGIKTPVEDISVKITSSTTSLSDGKVDVSTVSAYLPRKINGIRLYDGDIIVRISKGYNIVGYKNTDFELNSKGYYKIISPKEAVELAPKYTKAIWGDAFSSTGYITSIELCYFGLTQNNIQPVYVITGYTDKNKKDQVFSVIIPAVR